MRAYPGLVCFGAAVLLAATGCPIDTQVVTSGGTDDPTTTTTPLTTTTGGELTSSPTSEGPPTTGEPGYDGVVAPVIRSYRTLAGAVIEAVHDPLPELASVEIVAGGQSYPAVFDGNERLLFANVPEVSYLLRQQQPPDPVWPDVPGRISGVFTTARELGNFAGIYSGRPEVAQTSDLATRIEVTATGMAPLGPEDQFEIFSYNADAQILVFPDLDPMASDGSPAPGDTAISGWSVPWRPDTQHAGWPLVDPQAGDDLWLGQLVAGRLVEDPTPTELQDAWSYAQVYRLAAHAALTPAAAMTGGATTAASGAFAPVEPKTIAVDLRAAAFMDELLVYDSAIRSVGCFAAVVLEPGIEHPILGMTPQLGGVNVYGQDVAVDPMCPPDSCDPQMCDSCDSMFVMPGDRALDVTYGNPYAGGTETLVVQCSRYVFVEEPDGQGYDWLAADLVVSGRAEVLAQGPIVPKVGLVRDLQVNGGPLPPDESWDGVGMTPTITWQAPAFGAPDYYTITVRTIDDFDGVDGVVERRAVASFRTEFTSVEIPEGVLEPGGHYYVQVAAERGRRITEAVPDSHDVYVSRAMTGIFTP